MEYFKGGFALIIKLTEKKKKMNTIFSGIGSVVFPFT